MPAVTPAPQQVQGLPQYPLLSGNYIVPLGTVSGNQCKKIYILMETTITFTDKVEFHHQDSS